MTKAELIKAIEEYPNDTPIGLMFDEGDTCSITIDRFTSKIDDSLDTRIIVLRPEPL